ncbi:MAG: TetR/AcrR family transcriptional regulator [Candidatus Dadabacteria bacterium]|nr:MAG: TetR/AcrR family transcriptional regulator [Candidatus Dadabacteria bacterium]
MRSQQKKERILEAAELLFAEAGYEGATVRRIAEAANANVASINYHFGSKHALWLETLQRVLDGIRDEAIAEISAYQGNASAFIDQALRRFFDYFLEREHHVRLIYHGQARGDSEVFLRLSRPFFEQVYAFFDTLNLRPPAGIDPPLALMDPAYALLSLIHRRKELEILLGGDFRDPAFRDRLLRHLSTMAHLLLGLPVDTAFPQD